MISCPVCGRKSIGKVGSEQYYCWDCCIEFAVNGHNVKVFSIQDDGTLAQYTDPMHNTV